jgi:hypothetical protein
MPVMAEMFVSTLVQETVSKSVSFVLGKREEKASQGHLMERLQMAVSELEFALERAQELPIRHLSLLGRRKQIKSAYNEAMELLDKHKQQQAVPAGQELQTGRGVKHKRWNFWANNMSLKPFVGLSTDAVRRFEWYADHAGRFVRDVESGCSLHHYTFCNPIVRHLLEGKTLVYYHLEQGNLLRGFYIWPVYSDERGLEAVLAYRYGNSIINEKYFFLLLFLRLSESTDIVGVAIKGLQLLASEFKLATEFAMGELTLLSNLQDIGHSYGPPCVGFQEHYINDMQLFRPDPACCKGSNGLCGNNNVSSELSDMFPEQVIFGGFECRSFDMVGRSKSRGGGKPPLSLSADFWPHAATETQDSYALERMGDVQEYRDTSTQQVAEGLKLDAINRLLCQPKLTEYRIDWYSKHGAAWFTVKKASTERADVPKTSRRYNTRRSTRRSSRRC